MQGTTLYGKRHSSPPEAARGAILCVQCTFYIAISMPREGKAYCSMPPLECGRTLIVLNERGWATKDEVFDKIT